MKFKKWLEVVMARAPDALRHKGYVSKSPSKALKVNLDDIPDPNPNPFPIPIEPSTIDEPESEMPDEWDFEGEDKDFVNRRGASLTDLSIGNWGTCEMCGLPNFVFPHQNRGFLCKMCAQSAEEEDLYDR